MPNFETKIVIFFLLEEFNSLVNIAVDVFSIENKIFSIMKNEGKWTIPSQSNPVDIVEVNILSCRSAILVRLCDHINYATNFFHTIKDITET